MDLEEIFQKTKNIEQKFKKKKILFIPSESYDAATITIIEGLHTLGFEILVYKKMNINSWFCNTIVDTLDDIEEKVDFVLSNLHWGTRWDFYKNLNHKVPYILIDGDDHNNCNSWKDKYWRYYRGYKKNISDAIKNNILSPYRWMEEIYVYNPDIIFKSQKFNNEGIYLPFGINKTYILKENTKNREIDIANFPGPGGPRATITNFINRNFKNYKVSNRSIYGNMIVDNNIKNYCKKDNNVHSWHRWRVCDKYFETMKNSKICIYVPAPGGWDSKRQWEALAQGAFVIFNKPVHFDNSQYPLQEICEEFKNTNELVNKCEFLLKNPDILERKREECYEKAMKYFTSVPIARYFLWNIIEFEKQSS